MLKEEQRGEKRGAGKENQGGDSGPEQRLRNDQEIVVSHPAADVAALVSSVAVILIADTEIGSGLGS